MKKNFYPKFSKNIDKMLFLCYIIKVTAFLTPEIKMTVGQRVATGSVLFIVGAIAVGLGLDGYRPVQTLIHGGVGIGIVGLALAMSFAMPD